MSVVVESAAPTVVPAGARGSIPVVVCIDVEPDDRVIDPTVRADWHGFERAVEDFARFRRLFADATGRPARFSWFLRMDEQIEHVYGAAAWAAVRYAAELRAIEAAGDSVGLHIHPWRWDGHAGSWVVDFTDRRWGARCVRRAFAAFAGHFGRRCRAVRFGDRWLNDRMLALAERLGARYDLTAEPGRTPEALPERTIGDPPDYSDTPRRPYRPSRWRHQRAGRWFPRRLWMLPLSTGRFDWALRVLEDRASRASRTRPGGDGGAYEGWIDAADARAIAGWVCDRNAPYRVVDVEVWDGDRPIATLPAGLYRPDLAAAGMGDGRHAFSFPLAHRLRDGRAHTLAVRVAGTEIALRGGPVTVAGPADPAAGEEWLNLDLGRDSAILSAMVDALLTHHPAPCLALVVRSASTANAATRGSVEQTLHALARHPRASDFAFVTPPEAVRLVERRGGGA